MIKHKPIRKRPKNLNLFTIRLPVNAVVSIMHRASGMALFLVLPLLLWSFQVSLENANGYAHIYLMANHWCSKLILIAISWAFFHHFFAGLRHLAMDVHWMTSLQKSRLSSRMVIGVSIVCVVIFSIWVW
jgi:succinate dehydrogenase / fumarate reductase, cytochrome b subunit